MANRFYREVDKDPGGGSGPTLRTPQSALPLDEKSFAWPTLPRRPRRVHKPLGRRVKTAVREDY